MATEAENTIYFQYIISRLNWQQRAMADYWSVTESAVSKWHNGRINVPRGITEWCEIVEDTLELAHCEGLIEERVSEDILNSSLREVLRRIVKEIQEKTDIDRYKGIGIF